ncbi:MAG: ABC transporter permease, partial [Candidatus Dormibacteraceae bacterium]
MASNALAPVRQRSRLAELAAYRRLVFNLTQRDLRLKYKGSVLGIAWSFLNPLLQMAIYTVIFSLFLRVVLVPHAWVFLIGGILFWTFFQTSLIGASSSLVRNTHL